MIIASTKMSVKCWLRSFDFMIVNLSHISMASSTLIQKQLDAYLLKQDVLNLEDFKLIDMASSTDYWLVK